LPSGKLPSCVALWSLDAQQTTKRQPSRSSNSSNGAILRPAHAAAMQPSFSLHFVLVMSLMENRVEPLDWRSRLVSVGWDISREGRLAQQ
jgi:hypothetical protein